MGGKKDIKISVRKNNLAAVVVAVAVIVVLFLVFFLPSGDTGLPVQSPVTPTSIDRPRIVRKAAVAGQFYPGEKEDLRRMVEDYLSSAKSADLDGELGEPRRGDVEQLALQLLELGVVRHELREGLFPVPLLRALLDVIIPHRVVHHGVISGQRSCWFHAATVDHLGV